MSNPQSFRVYQLATLADGSIAMLTDHGQLIIKRHVDKTHSSATFQPKGYIRPLVYSADGPYHFFDRSDFDSLRQYQGDSGRSRSMAF